MYLDIILLWVLFYQFWKHFAVDLSVFFNETGNNIILIYKLNILCMDERLAPLTGIVSINVFCSPQLSHKVSLVSQPVISAQKWLLQYKGAYNKDVIN